MNYLDIVIDGYFNPNNREYLTNYFFREFKKAEKEYFEVDEFFSGCLKFIESLEKDLKRQVYERLNDLSKLLDSAENGTLKYQNNKGKSIEENHKETIEYCIKELKDIRPDGVGDLSFTINMSSFTNNRFFYHMKYNEVLFIKASINKAEERVKTESEQNKNNKKQEHQRLHRAQQSFDKNIAINKEQLLKENENNDFINSTIEDYLEPIKKHFNDTAYDLLVYELNIYFKTGAFTNSTKIIKVVNSPNKKLIGWQLKELYHASYDDNRNMNIDYLKFGKQRISIFKDTSFDEKQITNSNLYKYYHSKT